MTTRSLQAPAWLAAGARVVSTDEMPGIHALERTHPTLPMGPGRVARREFADIRRGTWTLSAHCDVAQGTVVAPSLGPTRTAEDFVTQLVRPGAADPAAQRWQFVPDTLHMHPSESLGRFVAEHDGITDDLGQQEQRGLLKSMATRAAFFSAPTPRIVFHYTPTHASWRNQSDMWGSILGRKWRKRASFTSGED